MKKFRTTWWTALIALACAGCSWGVPCGTPEEKSAFDTAAAHLDRGGMEYAIFTGKHLNRTFDRLRQDAERSIWEESSPHPEKIDAQKQLTIFRMVWQLCGFEQLQAAGFSSKTLDLNPYGENFKHSKVFLALPPDDPGFLNSFLGGNDLPAKELFGNLPQETIFAAGAALDPDAIFQAFKRAGSWGENTALALADAMPLEELRTLKGVWQIAVLDKRFQAARLIIPTNSKLLPEMIKKMFPAAVVIPEKDRLTVYTSPAAQQIFQRDALKMHERGDFEMLTGGMPDEGVAYVFGSKEFSDRKSDLDLYSVTTRNDDGILFLANSHDSVLQIMSDALIFALSIYCAENDEPQAATPAPAKPENASPAPAKPVPHGMAALQILAANRDNWSATPGFPGLQATFKNQLPVQLAQQRNAKPGADNCAVLYFGKSAQVTHPLAISRPQSNADTFLVLYNNGKIETYQLAKADSCRRIVSFLHTLHRWEEADFQRLIALAEKFDQKKIK